MAPCVADRLQGAVPSRSIDTNRPDFDTVIAGTADDLRDGIKAHRLPVDEGRTEGIGIVAFHVVGGIGDERERSCVRLWKAVRAKPFQLAERLFVKFGRVAVLDHAGDEFVLELADTASELEGGRRFSELIGLTP